MAAVGDCLDKARQSARLILAVMVCPMHERPVSTIKNAYRNDCNVGASGRWRLQKPA
jgi:hypothetical protein